MPLGLGVPELVIILIILVLVFGVGKLADVGGAMGRGIREFKREVNNPREPEKLEDSERERQL
ncbi:MAG TPA: twin-arginine translocase TatA/TatE family subunit [Ardenticatenaceae bacterium]|jgi:sec-independent protein translocase protein TatA